MEDPQQIRSNGDYTRSSNVEKIETEPLIRIPDPPESYIEFKCLIQGLEEDERQYALKGLYKKNPEWKREIAAYMVRLYHIRNHNMAWAEMALAEDHVRFQGPGISPIEKIEIRESDRKKHGRSTWMLIVDFEYWREDGELKRRKIYISLDPEAKKYDRIRKQWNI